MIRTYRGFLDRRRAARPQEEYPEPTAQEWRDFQQPFELSKVSLGTCGRPYGTPCKHEHAWIRCPVLQMDPRQRSRLLEIKGAPPVSGPDIDEARSEQDGPTSRLLLPAPGGARRPARPAEQRSQMRLRGRLPREHLLAPLAETFLALLPRAHLA